MEKSANTASKLISKSFWKSSSGKALYSIQLPGPYAAPNFPMVYDLQYQVYTPSTTYFAEHRPSPGGIDENGFLYMLDIIRGQVQGVFRGKDIIVWDDGVVWYRTTLPVNTTHNIYAPGNAFEQAERDSFAFSRSYNAAYPNLYASQFSDSLVDDA